MKQVYLDYAATTPVDPRVLEAMLPYFSEQFYNPSATYEAARTVRAALQKARTSIAHYIGCRSSELTFTAGGTEANNLAIHGVLSAYPSGEVVVSSVEHDSIIMPAIQRDGKFCSVHPDGRVDIQALQDAISDNTVLVSIQYVNNEIGTIQPLKEVSQIVQTVRKQRRAQGIALPLYLHTDACQAGNYLDLHANRLGVDLMTINASKIYGPKQIGALYARSDVHLKPQIVGGGQERGLRSGTENVAGIIGFATALQLAQERRNDEAVRVGRLQRRCIEMLEEKCPQIHLNGSVKHRIANNVHITVPGYDNETLMMQLDMRGFICAVGSACSASNEEPSHVLKAIGLSDVGAQSSLRFTMGLHTSEEEIIRLVDELAKLIG